MSTPPVKIYSLSTCSHCKSTKKMLADCTIQYDFVDVDTLEGEERAARNSIPSVRFRPSSSAIPLLSGSRKRKSRRPWDWNERRTTL
jgi:glutaredoxin